MLDLTLSIFAFGALGLLAYLQFQKVTIKYGDKGKYVTALPEDGTYLVVWRGNQIALLLFNPAPGWGVYIHLETRTYVILSPEMIDALKHSSDAKLREIGDQVYERFVTRGENFDFGVQWDETQSFFKDVSNVFFMGLEEFNVEKIQIVVEKHAPTVLNKETQAEEIISTQSETIPTDGMSPLVRILFDHQMISPGKPLSGLGYSLDESIADDEKYNVPGAFSLTYAANLVLFTIKPLTFIALAKQNAIDVADKVNSLFDTRFLVYSQAKTYREVIEENKEEKATSLAVQSSTANGLYENLFHVNGFDLNDPKQMKQLLELDPRTTNGERLPDTTGLALFKYDVAAIYLDQKEILKTLRLQQEYIITNQANTTNEEGKLRVAKAHAPVARQNAINNYKENEWEAALQEAMVDSLKGASNEILEVMKYSNLPEGILSYGDGRESGGVIAISPDKKIPPTSNPQGNKDFKKGSFKKNTNWKGKGGSKPNNSQNTKTT